MSDWEYRYIFHGDVHPNRASVSLDLDPFTVETEQGELEVDLSIFASKITVIVASEIEWYHLDLRNIVRSLVRSHINAFAYSVGYYYDMEISSVILPDDTRITFSIEHPALSDVLEEKNSNELIRRAINAGNGEGGQYSRRAISDFRDALEFADDTTFYCYRALESLKQFYAEEEMDDTKMWDNLWDELEMDNDLAVGEMNEFSKDLRHGEPRYIPGETRDEHIKFTWKAIDQHIKNVIDDPEETTNELSEENSKD